MFELETIIRPFHQPASEQLALALLQDQQVIAAPTDTVYGLMCRYDSLQATQQLYIIKSRPPQKAIPVLVGDISQLPLLTPTPPPAIASQLIDHFWPGPLTIVLPACPDLPPTITADKQTVAVRMPAHADLLKLLRRAGPLAATSANLSGRPEAYTAAQVAEQLPGRLRLILTDASPVANATVQQGPSTIVQISDDTTQAILLRAGPIAEHVRKHILQTSGATFVDATRN